MADAALMFGFGTPFQEQLDFLRQKLALPTNQWDDIQRAAHDRAFVVAGAAQAAMLADLQNAVIKAAAEGKGLAEFRKDFKSIVQKHGWTGWTGEGTKAGEAWRTRVIYQTNMATSYAAGRYQQLTEPAFLKLHPYWRYIHREGAINPRPQHLAWHGLTLRHDHAFWATHFAPNGWGCGCRITPVTQSEGRRSANAGLDEPPAGWDKPDPQTGAPVGIDKGFDYAPGQNRTNLDRMLLDPKLKQLFGKNPPAAIAHGAKPDSIEQVLTDFLSTFGEKVPAFKSLSIAPNMTAKMATYGDGRYLLGNDPARAKALNDAMQAIRQGAPLSAAQESMMKTLWHEIGHNRQTGLVGAQYAPRSTTHILLETTNEFVALRTYPQFLRAIGGGEAKHGAAVRADSGYGVFVGRLEAVMRAVGLNPDAMLSEIERVSFAGPIDDGKGGTILKNLSRAIAQGAKAQGSTASMTKISYAISVIKKPLNFDAALKLLS